MIEITYHSPERRFQLIHLERRLSEVFYGETVALDYRVTAPTVSTKIPVNVQ